MLELICYSRCVVNLGDTFDDENTILRIDRVGTRWPSIYDYHPSSLYFAAWSNARQPNYIKRHVYFLTGTYSKDTYVRIYHHLRTITKLPGHCQVLIDCDMSMSRKTLELTYSRRCTVPLGDTFYGQNTIRRIYNPTDRTSWPSIFDYHPGSLYFAAWSNDLNSPSGSAMLVVFSGRPTLHRKNCIV